MSITYFLIILLFLFFSLQACDALHLVIGALLVKAPDKDLHFSNKVEEKKGKVMESLDTSHVVDEVSINYKVNINNNTPQERNGMRKISKKDVKRTGLHDVRVKESVDSVTWKVPKKKRGEKQPGFNLDYSPPKTHPPSHN